MIDYGHDPLLENGAVQLWKSRGAWVIVECAENYGMRVSNQTHGIGCRHPEATGILVALPDLDLPHVGCWGGLSPDEMDELDKTIDIIGLSVDRSRCHGNEWGEAWVPVTGSMRGILTWENCD